MPFRAYSISLPPFSPSFLSRRTAFPTRPGRPLYTLRAFVSVSLYLHAPGFAGFQIVPRFATAVYFNCATGDVRSPCDVRYSMCCVFLISLLFVALRSVFSRRLLVSHAEQPRARREPDAVRRRHRRHFSATVFCFPVPLLLSMEQVAVVAAIVVVA